MRPQKGMGTARMGSKRAPHLFKGGKAHGAKPKVYSFTLNAKIKLNALKALLSAKLTEGKITFFNGTILEGDFKDEELDGIGKKTLPDGTVEEGLFYF